MPEVKNDISIVLSGAAGQGIQTVEDLLTRVLKRSGSHVFSTGEFMSRVRGGVNSTTIRVSTKRVCAYIDRIDVLIPLSSDAVTHVEERLSDNTVIIGDEKIFGDDPCCVDYTVLNVPFEQLAESIGGKIYANTVSLGLLARITCADKETLHSLLTEVFGRKGREIIDSNIKAANKGYEIADDLIKSGKLNVPSFPTNKQLTNDLLINGTQAVALGAIAGGCNYSTYYPMAPGTGVSAFLADNRQEFSIIVDQSEDEISVINKAIGAWYAGARAIVSTSGGGFALMTEGLSLAGSIESPMVIHLAQRPGPATGLPTRTEQGDLELALYAGHGMFPRIIFSPGKLEDAFYLTQKAFDLADKYQVPVFILTDHYFVNTQYNIPEFSPLAKVEKHFIETGPDYKRFQFTEDGLTPRGIPGYGSGLIRADSHTHDEEGHITENPVIRTAMVDKYKLKLEQMKKEIIEPELVGNANYKTLVIGWGSTYHLICEALETLDRDDVAFLHFKQVYPLHPKTSEYLKKAEKKIIIENNPTSQFGNLIKMEVCFDFDERILKYNGMPFSVEELVEKLQKVI
ncbi:MAG: 2-oxoacid:acceptor oxidoreductase subunit alpha [Candidatus Odinarchaeota archaeon]